MRYLSLIMLLLIACSQSESERLAEQLVSDTEFSYDSIEPKAEPIVEAKVEKIEANEQNITEPNIIVETAVNVSTPEVIITQIEVNESVEEIKTVNASENKTEVNETEVNKSTNSTNPPLYYFFNLFNDKIKSYQFVYKGNKYFVKGTKYKILLWRPTIVQNAKWANGTRKNAFYYDTIYVNRVQKTATAYCEGYKSEVNKKCAELELYELAYELPFNEHNLILPEDWLYSYLNREPFLFEENKYEVGSRSTIMFAFNDTFTTELNFDQKTGLVIRADQKMETNLIARYDYEDLAVNTVRDVDVIHRKKEDIPASDAFYKVV